MLHESEFELEPVHGHGLEDGTGNNMDMSIRGVIGVKCTGQNNFNTNHFQSSSLSDFFLT
jgi:hypothetical protein